MTRKRNRALQPVASAERVNSASGTSVAETVVLGLMATIAITSAAIGVWSILAFVSVLSNKGPAALVAGFISAVTGG